MANPALILRNLIIPTDHLGFLSLEIKGHLYLFAPMERLSRWNAHTNGYATQAIEN